MVLVDLGPNHHPMGVQFSVDFGPDCVADALIGMRMKFLS